MLAFHLPTTVDKEPEFLEKYERIILPLVFVLLGVYILIEFGTLNYLLAFFH